MGRGLQRNLSQTRIGAKLKMLAMAAASAYGAVHGRTTFRSVAVETTTHCHRRCSYCPVSKDPKPARHMAGEVFGRIVTELAALQFDGRFCYHHYNEPLLNRNLEDLVRIAVTELPRAAHVIYTSGDHLTVARHQSLLAAGITTIVVTDHGPAKRSSSPVVDPASLAARDRVRLRRFDSSSALFNRGGLVEVATPRHHARCFLPNWEVVIDVDGNVILCCNDYYGEHSFGNVMNTRLIEIFQGEEFRSLRVALARGRFERPICQACAGIA